MEWGTRVWHPNCASCFVVTLPEFKLSYLLHSLKDRLLEAFKIKCPAIFQVVMVPHRLRRKRFAGRQQGEQRGRAENCAKKQKVKALL